MLAAPLLFQHCVVAIHAKFKVTKDKRAKVEEALLMAKASLVKHKLIRAPVEGYEGIALTPEGAKRERARAQEPESRAKSRAFQVLWAIYETTQVKPPTEAP